LRLVSYCISTCMIPSWGWRMYYSSYAGHLVYLLRPLKLVGNLVRFEMVIWWVYVYVFTRGNPTLVDYGYSMNLKFLS
jgi:hypothetical protein